MFGFSKFDVWIGLQSLQDSGLFVAGDSVKLQNVSPRELRNRHRRVPVRPLGKARTNVFRELGVRPSVLLLYPDNLGIDRRNLARGMAPDKVLHVSAARLPQRDVHLVGGSICWKLCFNFLRKSSFEFYKNSLRSRRRARRRRLWLRQARYSDDDENKNSTTDRSTRWTFRAA